MYTIKVMFMSGPNDGATVWLKDHAHQGYAILNGWEFVIGRRDGCDLIVPFDTQVSREHAHLRIQQDKLYLQDASSRNGIHINTHLINGATQIHTGDLFRIGQTWLRVEDFTQ